ncbi:MAG: hypothetical protein QXP42_04395, partial [Candidatus Micrarchaeia archaeon]
MPERENNPNAAGGSLGLGKKILDLIRKAGEGVVRKLRAVGNKAAQMAKNLGGKIPQALKGMVIKIPQIARKVPRIVKNAALVTIIAVGIDAAISYFGSKLVRPEKPDEKRDNAQKQNMTPAHDNKSAQKPQENYVPPTGRGGGSGDKRTERQTTTPPAQKPQENYVPPTGRGGGSGDKRTERQTTTPPAQKPQENYVPPTGRGGGSGDKRTERQTTTPPA